HQRNIALAEVGVTLHLGRNVGHFFQAGGDQAGQAHNIGLHFLGLGEDLGTRHHHAHIHHFKVIALHHHGHNVLADVMYIAFHCGNHHAAFGAHVTTRGFNLTLFFFDERNQVGHSLLHHTRGFHHLRQEHLALTEQVAHHVHAVHQGAFNHADGATTLGIDLLTNFFRIFHDEAG